VNGFTGMCPYGPEGQRIVLTGAYRAYRLPYDAVPQASSNGLELVAGAATLLQHPSIR